MKVDRQQVLIIAAVAAGFVLLATAVMLVVKNFTTPSAGQPARPGELSESALTGLPEGLTYAETATPTPTSEGEPTGESTVASTASGAAEAGPTPTFNPNITPNATHSGDTYDSHDTVFETLLTPGVPVEGEVIAIFDAHNYYYEGKKGEKVLITVVGEGETDPRVTVLSPTGTVIGENDDTLTSLNASLSLTLPVDGTYTIRVTVWEIGAYTLTLDLE